MLASEFLRKVTADEIKKASDDSDAAEDASRGERLDGTDFISRMNVRLQRDYPGLFERIEQFVEGQSHMVASEEFLLGMWAGATMLAHDVTIAAEVHDANQMLGGSH